MRSSRKAIAITVLLAVVLLLAMTAPALAERGGKALPENILRPAGPDWVDGTYSMRVEKEQATRAYAAKFGVQSLISKTPGVQGAVSVGHTFTVEVSDDYMQTVYNQEFVVESVGDHGIICIAKEAYDSYDGSYHFDNPVGDDSEAWLRSEDLITPTQLDYMLNVFDTTIWNTMSPIFGTPLPRGAEGDKVWILIFNIRDEAYYEEEAESYIAGYFSSAEDAANNKNMMHIDTYDWANRMGAGSARPFLYEGVFAHEYQHLLHFDMDPDEESWVDEGLADLAAFLCGYMEDNGHVLYYILYHPYTPLTFWGGGLENYGACYLFQLYLYEQYGGTRFTKALFREQANGITGVQNTLDRYGRRVKFDTVFDNWTLANYFDMTAPAKYGYRNIDLGPDTYGETIPGMLEYYTWDAWFWDYNDDYELFLPFDAQGSWYYYWYYPAGPMPYTAQYYPFAPYSSIAVSLDGNDTAGVSAYSGSRQMLSGQGTWTWRSFYKTFAVPAEIGAVNSSLQFYAYYDIESEWDYGYVEVWDQTADEYYTLPLTSGASTVTVDYVSFPQDNPNCPDGREPTDYEAAGRWNALTGSSNGWVQLNADLTPFAGHTITIYFRTWQDGAYTLPMMYVDAVALGWSTGGYEVADFETGMDGWATPAAGDSAGWTRGTGLVANDWQGTLVRLPSFNPMGRYNPAVTVYNTKMNSSTQAGTITAKANPLTMPSWLYIVSNRADHILVSDYYLEAWAPMSVGFF